jgi:ABC-type nitrate/sulfonate/bicarbonate transport system substrate-binding protein
MYKFKIGGVPEHFNAPWLYAIQQDLFKKAGLEIEFISYPTGTGAMCEALQSRELDLAVLLTEGAVAHIARGGNVDIIAAYVNTPLNWGIHVASDSIIKVISELKRAKFAISRYGSGSHLMSYLLATQQTWDLKHDLSFIEAGKLDNLCEVIKQHKADILLWEVFMTKQKVKEGQIKCIGTIPTPWSAFMIVARKDIKENFASELEKLLKILYHTTNYFNANHSRINYFIAEKYDLTLDNVNSWLKTVDWATNSTIPVEQIRLAQTFLLTASII